MSIYVNMWKRVETCGKEWKPLYTCAYLCIGMYLNNIKKIK